MADIVNESVREGEKMLRDMQTATHPKIHKKFCPECRTIKPTTDFSPKKKEFRDDLRPEKRQSLCRPCNSLKRREYPFKTYTLDKETGKYVWNGGYR